MRIFVLEDEDYRIQWFRESSIGCVLDITKDVEEAKRWLNEREYDQIFLDHDLADEHYVAFLKGDHYVDAEQTGYAVAKHLANHPQLSPNATVVVHSMNPTGSKRMVDKLTESRQALWVSFPILRERGAATDQRTEHVAHEQI